MDSKKEPVQSVQQLTPLSGKDRLNHIDSLRGFALLGILIVNMLAFQYGIFGQKFIFPILSTADQSTHILVEWFFQGSFYPIFSMLFGFGAIIMWERIQANNRSFTLLFIRRILILLVIGFVHLYFIWDGDILVTYAITAFIFVFFIKRKAKTLLIWSLVIGGLLTAIGLVPDDGEEILGFEAYGEYEQNVLRDGSYTEIVHFRLTSNPFEKVDFGMDLDPLEREIMITTFVIISYFSVSLQTFFLFLLGGFFAKIRWLHDVRKHKGILIKLTAITIPIGLLLKGAMVFTDNSMLDYVGYITGGPVLAVGYVTGFCLLFLKFNTHRIFNGVGYVGRMALTNYLIQSIVMTFIFYGYGFGLLGEIGTLLGTLLAFALFLLQVLFSKWWLNRFHYGPMEWFWRTGTYLNVQKLKK
ncbi:DUF418 domain-containing protein [Evansella sp. AB-P1]|uniref:DUF418 domain-containing protein n=1 Tax=Evansella sp. AB-P1 TaxID=3037653 RepID=UPI00241D239D|nr:DUF418 domain-containing protein [Evansella sp. AB-P1]MDG5785961.1 DUF418 domain-containing protein [Evansella sp. AB-P1]